MSPKTKWWIKKIGKGWWIGHGNVTLGNFFFTWEHAYAEAVRRTHIVEAELPPEKPGRQKFLQNSYVRGAAFDQVVQLVDMADHECIYIDKFDWKELGEYLLALHYHHERNQK